MSIRTSLADVRFVCPKCRAPVELSGANYACGGCSTSFPIVAGIPDFRVAPDPWIGLVEDREKGLRLEAETAGRSFAEMVRAYWAMTPETPRDLAERFIAHVLEAESRTTEWLTLIGAGENGRDSAPWIDIGCGTADLAAAAPHARVVGIDVAFRWLVVARRRLVERGIEPLLVCCNAEALPFPDAVFSRALSLGTLEHCEVTDVILREARRVLRSGGMLNLRTGNKHSVMRNRADFRYYWPKSAGEIVRGLARAGFAHSDVGAGTVLRTEATRLPSAVRRLLPVYETVRRAPLLRTPASWLTPVLEVRAVAP